MSKPSILLVGTHPDNANGYSKVVHSLATHLKNTFTVTVYGVQRRNPTATIRREPIEGVTIVDAAKLEGYAPTTAVYDTTQGYGISGLPLVVDLVKPDFTLIYNSPDIILPMQKAIVEGCEFKTKIIPYIDMVYEGEEAAHYVELTRNAWGVAFFTQHWADKFRSYIDTETADRLKWMVIRHGIDVGKYFPVNRRYSKLLFGIDPDAFVFGNLNRNNLRKRLDLTMQVFVTFLERWYSEGATGRLPVLLIGQRQHGGWDLDAIYQYLIGQSKVLSTSSEDMKRHLVFVKRPQQYSDAEINAMMHACDVGLNTCVGEGWGLCNYEHAWVGAHQIVPDIGGFKEWAIDERRATRVPVSVTIFDVASESSNHRGVNVAFKLVNPLEVAQAMYVRYHQADSADLGTPELDTPGSGFFSWSSIAEDLTRALGAHEIPEQ